MIELYYYIIDLDHVNLVLTTLPPLWTKNLVPRFNQVASSELFPLCHVISVGNGSVRSEKLTGA